MVFIYDIFISLFVFLIILATPFNNKARLWLSGRKKIFTRIKAAIKPGSKIIWVHCASLGEFEQGRPLIEELKKRRPEYEILLTFFSPSGYEVRKNYSVADYIFYLPVDLSFYAKHFIKIVNPAEVYFIKYENWFNYLRFLKRNNIPVYSISSIFRKDQIYFKFYGGFFRRILRNYTHLFVQNETSRQLLNSIGITKITVVGDTRFDRVFQIASNAKKLPVVEEFAIGFTTIICGSTWPVDEGIICEFINNADGSPRCVIAPHEIDEAHINNLFSLLKKPAIRYSDAEKNGLIGQQILIIDNIGMLSSIYRYGKLAYIGGGFGIGIHNILEAATFGMPILFGPKYKKFQEAIDLINLGGAFSINNFQGLSDKLQLLLSSREMLETASRTCKDYVTQNIGATEKILNFTLKD